MYQEESLNSSINFLGESQLHLFENAEITNQEVKVIADKIYSCIIRVKKAIEKKENINSFDILRFITFLILSKITTNNLISHHSQIQLFILDIFKLEKKNKYLSEQDIVKLATFFNIKISTEDKQKITQLLNKMGLNKIPFHNQEFVIKVFGQVYEKIVNKREIGAYYTTENTTKYITTNSIVPNIITNWANQNQALKKYLNHYYKEKSISFIEDTIQQNQDIEVVFFELINKFDTKGLKEVIKKIKVIDISCGSGSFIFSAYFLLKKIYHLIDDNNSNYLSIFANNLHGIDIDEEAIFLLKFRILLTLIIDDKKISNYKLLTTNFIIGNSLAHNKTKDAKLNDNTNKSIFEESTKIRQIISKGGFDVVLGNPPYVEYRKVKKEYVIENFSTIKCNNLYAFILEKNFHILKENGHLGMIVPISYTSTKRMNPIRHLLVDNSSYQFCSSYADRPSCLFNGVHQKLNIILLQKNTSAAIKKIYTSSYIHWYKREKDEIFKQLVYVNNNFPTIDFLFKIGNEVEKKIIEKLINPNRRSLLDNTLKASNHRIWLNMRMCFWNKSFTFPQKSNEYKAFHLKDQESAILFSALLNTNIFFFFWETISDAWHITLKDLRSITIDFEHFSEQQKKNIIELYLQLEKKLDLNKRKIDSKQTEFEYQHKKDKILIDKIDLAFGDYFALSEKEIAYIRDYQLNFRLNGELNNYLKLRENECN